MHLGVVHPRLEARGRPFPRFPWSRSRVNLRVLRPLTRGPQGQPSPLQTPHRPPGVQGIFPTSRGQALHGWPMVHHSMATGFPIPRDCCLALSASHSFPCFPLPHPVTGPLPVPCGFPIPRGCCAVPFHPPSRVYTTPGRQQPCGVGPLDPHPYGDCFVRLALVAPFPSPPLPPVPRPVTDLGLFPESCLLQVSLGPWCDPSHTPLSALSLIPASRVFTPPGRQQAFGAGPPDPHPAWDPLVGLALFAPFTSRSAWVVCRPQDLWWFLLPGPRAPHYSCLSPTWSPVVVAFASFFRAPPAVFRLPVCSMLFPWRPLALRFSPSCVAAGFCSCSPPPLPCRASCLVVPSSLHARTTTLHRPSVTAPLGVPVLSLGSPRPCQVGARPSRLTHFSVLRPPLSPVSCPPSFCCSPAPCVFPWSSPRHGCILRAFTRLRASALSSDG